MQRKVTAHLEITVEREATIVFAIAVASGVEVEESLTFHVDGVPVSASELPDAHGTRLHKLVAPVGNLVVDYRATVTGLAEVTDVPETDLIQYLRPSRYCESDSLTPTAQAEFAGLEGVDLLPAVSSWVGTKLSYVPGSSLPTDGAVRTLLAREGVCRDYAHLVVTLLRALGVPARLAAAYAPGLDPMDFHAVAEAYVNDAWHVVDATTLAPRHNLLRIATGRDASDTAFMSVLSGLATLDDAEVTATADVLATDNVHELVQLR